MSMMFVVAVPVFMFHRLVNVFVLVTLSQMQPDPDSHEGGGDPKWRRNVISQQNDGQHRARERCN